MGLNTGLANLPTSLCNPPAPTRLNDEIVVGCMFIVNNKLVRLNPCSHLARVLQPNKVVNRHYNLQLYNLVEQDCMGTVRGFTERLNIPYPSMMENLWLVFSLNSIEKPTINFL